ncbi:hypothetical protein [Pelagibius litoralis]|nr:hypothetical protein [Pelagibius litoralis]
MTLKTIRLELARDHDFPNGSPARGYEMRAPLTPEGHIDAEGWRKNRDACRVTRFWEGEGEESGHLRHTRGGTWAFHYDLKGDPDDDELGYKFESHVFNEGEYVSIREHDGALRTFRVVTVR